MEAANIPAGLRYERSFLVEPSHCISRIDANLPRVLGTFVIVEWMEIASAMSVMPYLGDGYLTVGTRMALDHTSIAVPGSSVSMDVSLRQRERNALVFEITALLRGKAISRAVHHRSIIPSGLIQRQITREERRNEPVA